MREENGYDLGRSCNGIEPAAERVVARDGVKGAGFGSVEEGVGSGVAMVAGVALDPDDVGSDVEHGYGVRFAWRYAILRHLSSLPLPSRQSFLTVTSPSFVQILLKMSAQIAKNGPSVLFFLLPDLPSRSPPTSPSLPSLLSRPPTSFISRQPSLFPAISDGILLFGLKNEQVLDSITVNEDLVADVDRFVELMDRVSNGNF